MSVPRANTLDYIYILYYIYRIGYTECVCVSVGLYQNPVRRKIAFKRIFFYGIVAHIRGVSVLVAIILLYHRPHIIHVIFYKKCIKIRSDNYNIFMICINFTITRGRFYICMTSYYIGTCGITSINHTIPILYIILFI